MSNFIFVFSPQYRSKFISPIIELAQGLLNQAVLSQNALFKYYSFFIKFSNDNEEKNKIIKEFNKYLDENHKILTEYIIDERDGSEGQELIVTFEEIKTLLNEFDNVFIRSMYSGDLFKITGILERDENPKYSVFDENGFVYWTNSKDGNPFLPHLD